MEEETKPAPAVESAATPAQCEQPYSAIHERRLKAKRARTLRTVVTIGSAVVAVGGVVAGIVGGVAAAARKARDK